MDGPSKTYGYFADPEKTAAAFHGVIKGQEDGRVYLQTGDQGFIYEVRRGGDEEEGGEGIVTRPRARMSSLPPSPPPPPFYPMVRELCSSQVSNRSATVAVAAASGVVISEESEYLPSRQTPV